LSLEYVAMMEAISGAIFLPAKEGDISEIVKSELMVSVLNYAVRTTFKSAKKPSAAEVGA